MTTGAPAARTLWIGTYPDPSGSPEGVWSVRFDPSTGAFGRPVLRARTPVPSFLALTPDGGTLLAAGETSPGAVTAFAVEPDGGLTQRQRVASGGVSPCHLLVHPAGRAVYAANYGSGSVAVLPLRRGADGRAELVGGVAQVFEHSGRGPVADRQEGPHAHSTTLTPDGAALLAFDLGTDEVRRYRVRPDGLLDADGVAAGLPPGTGPRHAAWGRGELLYVAGELDAAVHVLAWADGELRAADVVAVDGGGPGALPSHVAVAGRRLLVALRGPDVVAVRDLADDGGAGAHVDVVDVGAAGAVWPRHFAVVPGPRQDWLVVAGQGADRVAALPLDGAGASSRGPRGAGVSSSAPAAAVTSVTSVTVPAPACVVVGREDAPEPG